MARGRLIDKSISNSRKVNGVSDRAALLFTWILPHTDDYGRVEGGADDVLFSIVPRRNWSLEEVCDAIEELYFAGLIRTYRVEGRRYIEVYRFDDFQILRKDRSRTAKCPLPIEYDAEWVRMVANGKPMTPKAKPVEVSPVIVSRSRKEVEVETEVEVEPQNGAKAPHSPKEYTQQFFQGVLALKAKEDVPWLKELLTNIATASNITKAVVWGEVQGFTDYWTELTHTGQKTRWQCQKTFMVERRLQTWFNRAGFKSFATGAPAKSKGKEIIGLDDN